MCHSLDTLEARGPSALAPGTHLVAIYNDNFLSSLDFTLCAVPLEPVGGDATGSGGDAGGRVAAMVTPLKKNYNSTFLKQVATGRVHSHPCPRMPPSLLKVASGSELQDKKKSLNKLAETIVSTREALIKAQEE